MITSTKNYTKKNKNKKTDRQNPRTNGKSKAYTDKITHRSRHIHTHKKRKRKKIYVLLLPKSTTSIWDDSLSVQVFQRCRVPQVDCGHLIRCSSGCWERFPLLFPVRTAPGVQLWIWTRLCV